MSQFFCRFILSLLILGLQPVYSVENDVDDDGVLDPVDNCINVGNTDQRDTDCDGFGNLCDGDLDNDGFVSTPDLALFRQVFFIDNNNPSFNKNADFDGDGVISTPDLAIFRGMLFQTLGPSGLVTNLQNTCPQADAGLDRTLSLESFARLNGTKSSDKEGDSLTYFWAIESVPNNSDSIIDEISQPRPKIQIDRAGAYVAKLKVNDGLGYSEDTVILSTSNIASIANAGPDQTVQVGENAILNASNSSDANYDELTFQWVLVAKPSGSTSQLTNATSVESSISIDLDGEYIIQLVVNDGNSESKPDLVVIRTDNSRPVADAGIEETVSVNSVVELNGSNSSDFDSDSLSYRWSILSKPASSAAGIIAPLAEQTSITLDQPGIYIIQLIVNDGSLDSLADTVVYTTENSSSIANAGPDKSVVLGTSLALNGLLSSDPDYDPMTYQWSISSQPDGSNPVLSATDLANPQFNTDLSGLYTLELTVSDWSLTSQADVLQVTVTPPVVAIQASATSGTVPLETNLNAIPTGGYPPYSYEWDLDGNGSIDDTRKNFIYTFLQRGNFTINLKMTDSTGNEAVATQIINVNSAPVVVASATPSSGTAPLAVTFSATVSGADGVANRFDWDFDGDGIVDQSNNTSPEATHIYQNVGLYTAKLTVFDNDGLFTSDTVVISVGNPPQVTASADVFTGVAPLNVSFSGTVDDVDGQVVLYEWDFDGDKQFDYSSISSPVISHSYTTGGIFNATLRVSDNDGLIDEDSLVISVSGPPSSLPGAYPLSGGAPLTVTFFSDGKDLDGGPEFYDWDFDGDGTFDQRLIASQNTTFTYDQAGVYQATLKVIDDDGLSANASVTITVTESNNVPDGFPSVSAIATPSIGSTPLTVLLSGSASDDGSIAKYEWDFESDGTYDFSEQNNGIQLITEIIDVGSYAHQTFADFDADGDLDVIIGNSDGQMIYFLNTGNSNVFEFSNQGFIQDVGATTIDLGSYAAPFAYDIDGDNDYDMIVGNSSGFVYILENTGTIQAPVWVNNGLMTLDGGSNLDVGSYASPTVYQLGNDRDWDLLIGNSSGMIAVYENTGSNSFPVWVDNGDIQDNSAVVVDVGSYAAPLLIDHDGDTDLDLYVGESAGRIVYLENQGSNQNPVWVNQSYLVGQTGNTIDSGSYAVPVVVSTSGASNNDLWLGNSNGQIFWYQSGQNQPFSWLLRANPFNSSDVGGYASPALFDYDNNGVWDLVVGNSDGKLGLIQNLGTNENQILRPAGFIVDVLVEVIDDGSYASPAFTDLDNDGDDDLMVGYSDGRFVYYQNTGTAALPEWTSEGIVNHSGGGVLDIGSYSSPIFYDLDGDGDQDILAGNSAGQLYLIENMGALNSPVWATGTLINNANNSVIDVGSYAKPLISDVNADGIIDLLVGNSGGVIYKYENSSSSLPFVWSLKETLLDQVDVGSYAAPVAINLDNDVDEDLLIGNSAGLIYQHISFGNIDHTYTTEGNHTATFRATDDSGNTANDSVTIRVLPTGFPNLTLQANKTEGLIPLDVNFVATADDSDGTITKYEWDFDGDGNYELTGASIQPHTYTNIGAYNPRVRVTDNDGKQSTSSIPLSVKMQINVSHNAVINPGLGEKSSIATVLDSEATLTIKVVDELGNVVKTLVNNEFRPTGSYVDSWDGFDQLDNQVTDGAYYFVMNYSHNGIEGEIDARASSDFAQYTPSRTWPSAFNPYTGIPVTSTYTVNKPSEVSYYFWVRDRSRPGSTIAPVRTLFIRELKTAGSHTEIWDGVDDNGVPVQPGAQYPITLWVYELPDNAIVITGSKPVISNLSVDNRTFYPGFNPYSSEPNQTEQVRVQFEITKDATMDVVAIDNTGLQIDRFTKPGLTAGNNSISWDGHNFDDERVPSGIYSLQLTAIDSKGNRSIPRYAVVTVRD